MRFSDAKMIHSVFQNNYLIPIFLVATICGFTIVADQAYAGEFKVPKPPEEEVKQLEKKDEKPAEVKPLTKEEKGGCLIATATYGSELAPQVQLLREIRDNTVLSTASGTSFMTAFNAFYYSFSPTIADWERQNPAFKETVKVAITPLIITLSLLSYAEIDSEEEMLAYGTGIILANIGIYFAMPAFAVLGFRRVRKCKMQT